MTTSLLQRRSFLSHAAFGVAGMAAVDLWPRDGTVQAADASTAGLHHAAKAKHVIHIFLGGGLSQVDSFDYKPDLVKFHDQELPKEFGKADPFVGKAGRLHQSHYVFKQRGKSGLWMSELFPQLCEVADELTLINSMVAETANHIPGIFQANTGFRQMGFPAMESWLSYGLGNISDDLPSFVVLPDARGIPNAAGGSFNWSSGFLPAEHQGVPFNTKGGPPILDLQPASGLGAEAQRERLALLAQFNDQHLEKHVHTDLLAARIRSYEFAARMQAAIPVAMDFSSEPEHVQNCTAWTATNAATPREIVWQPDGLSNAACGPFSYGSVMACPGTLMKTSRATATRVTPEKRCGSIDRWPD